MLSLRVPGEGSWRLRRLSHTDELTAHLGKEAPLPYSWGNPHGDVPAYKSS